MMLEVGWELVSPSLYLTKQTKIHSFRRVGIASEEFVWVKTFYLWNFFFLA